MTADNNNASTDETLQLVGEVYKSILMPESFIEFLELWDKNLMREAGAFDKTLSILEDQLTNAIPLLESSLKSVVNEDELVNRLAEFDRPSLLISANGMVIGSNLRGQIHFNLREGDQIKFDLMAREDSRILKEIFQQAYNHESAREDTFKVINFASVGYNGQKRDQLVACRSIFTDASEIGYIILSAMDLVLSEAGAAAFQNAFSATDAEMRIVQSLIAGRRQTDIAKQDGIREDTVKKHIANLRDKAGVSNTTALVCLAASFAQISAEHGSFAQDNSRIAHSITNHSNQTYVVPSRHNVTTVNGMKVEYIDYGPPDGEVIMILHSSMVGFVLPPEFCEGFVSAGYRLVLPFRPGFGVSDPLPQGFSLEASAEHLLAFADAIGISSFSIMGGTTGFVHASQMAVVAPERIKCLIGIGGYLPIDRKALLANMAPYQRAVLFTQQKSRKLAKFLVLSGYKMYLQGGAHKFMTQIMRHSKADTRVVNNANSLGVLSIGLRIGGAQGVDAVLNDTQLILLDWKSTIEKIQCPVELFHGTDDSVYQAEDVVRFCEDYPLFNVTVLPDRGQLMIYDTPLSMARQIIDKLPAVDPKPNLKASQ